MAVKRPDTTRERLAPKILKKRWGKIAIILAGLVVFCTSYSLILPAVTMSSQQVNCGLEEHEHSEVCYDEEGNLICDLEEHNHTLACYADLYADIENEEIWNAEVPELTADRNADAVSIAKSLVGYRESDRNYLVSADDQTQGYTRFGHWYGEMVNRILSDSVDEITAEIRESLYAQQAEIQADDPEAEMLPVDEIDIKTEYAGEIASRISDKIAEKKIGILPSEIEDGCVERIGNGLPAYAYMDWNTMFVSYVLNYAGIPELGAETRAGSLAGALAASGYYVDADDYIPSAGDLVFFTPSAGADVQVGIVSRVNKNLFGLGKKVTSIDVILGDEENAVAEIRVAVGEYTEGDAVFEKINGYGVHTPREEAPEEDSSVADSVVGFFQGLVTPEAPADQAASDEAEAEISAEEETKATVQDSLTADDPEVVPEIAAEELTDADASAAAGEDEQKDSSVLSDDPLPEENVDGADLTDESMPAEKPDDAAKTADESDAAGKTVEAVLPADESVSEKAEEDEKGRIVNIADDTQHIIGATEEDLEVSEDREMIGAEDEIVTKVEAAGAELNEDGTALVMNWHIEAQLPEGILPEGTLIRVNTSTGKLHAMSAVQAKTWAGMAKVGGETVSFTDAEKYEITFIGDNGHLYTWDDVRQMKDDAVLAFTGIHVKVLSGDAVIENGGSVVEFEYPTQAYLADLNIGQNYYVTKAVIDGYAGTGTYTYENGEAVQVDQDRILQDANLDETGHAAGEQDINKNAAGPDGTGDTAAESKAGTLTASGKDYTVTMSYGVDADIPDVAKLRVSEIKPGTEDFANYISEARSALGIEGIQRIDLQGRFFDIKIMTKEGEFTPKAPVRVDIRYDEAIEDVREEDFSAVHFAEEGAESIAADAEMADGAALSVGFEAERFSVYGVVYTVDIHWEANGKNFEYSIPGGGYVSLEALVEALGAADPETDTADFVADVESVEFSDPSLVWVGKVNKNTTVGILKKENGLNPQYSAGLTERQIEKIDSSMVCKGDWALISILPFESEESLNVTMKNGDQFSVKMTDAQISTAVITAAGETYEIAVTYGEDAEIPEGASLEVEEITEDDRRFDDYYEKALKAAGGEARNVEASVLTYARFFDISILNGRKKVEPSADVSVTIRLLDESEQGGFIPSVVHFAKKGPEMMDADTSVDSLGTTEASFMTDSFSVYGVIQYPDQPSGINDLDGRTFTISRNNRYMTDESVSADTWPVSLTSTTNQSAAAEWHFEATGSAGTYNIFTFENGEKKYLNLDRRDPTNAHARLSSTPQAFSVYNNGSGYSFYTVSTSNPNQPTPYYLSLRRLPNTQTYAFSGQNVTTAGDDQRMTMQFTDLVANNNDYMVLVKRNDQYYMVENDGKLTPVVYENGIVTVNTPMIWTYENGNIYHHSTQVGFTYQNLPSDYYYKYIDPTSPNGWFEEKEGDGYTSTWNNPWDNPDAGPVVTNRRYADVAALIYTDHKLKSANGNTYIGMDPDTMKITGDVSEAEAVEVYFAKVDAVPPSANLNHTVNHIDIEINGGAYMDLPLAYGDYFYKDNNGVVQTLHVEHGGDVTLKLSKDSIGLEPDDMKHSTVTAYTPEKGVLNNAFYISGYSRNSSNNISDTQVRIEGSFKVADLEPYTHVQNEDQLYDNPQAGYTPLQDRLDNRIYYTVAVNKDVTLDWLYTYGTDSGGNPLTAQLYRTQEDAENEANGLNTEITVNLSKSFDYWDPKNACPPVQYTQNDWKKGHIVWDTSSHQGSGMDFTLDVESTESVVAVEIFKYLRTDDGEELKSKSDVTNFFKVYQKVPAAQTDYDGVINVGVDTPVSNQSVPAGYSLSSVNSVTVGSGKSQGLVYDYSVEEGMVCVEEDTASIPRSITDLNDDKWDYIGTETQTEYAWRMRTDYDGKRHKAEGTVAVPEVLGDYGTWINDQGQEEPLFNRFLEFHVYNVYKKVEMVSVPINKRWDDYAGDEYDWTATFQMEYIEQLVEGESEDPEHANPVTTWTAIGDPITIGKYYTEAQRTVTDLPKYRYDEYGNKYVRIYSASETAYEVKQGNTVVCSFDGTNYYPAGREYRPAWEHDANEHNDGDYELRVHNVIHEVTGGKETDVKISKVWSGDDAAIKAKEGTYASFRLKRRAHDEHIDWNNVNMNANDIIVTLVVGGTYRDYNVKPNQELWIVGNFEAGNAGNVGSVEFKSGSTAGDVITSLTHYYTNETQLVRSAPFRVNQNTTIVCARGDLSCFAGGADGVELTVRGNPETPTDDDAFNNDDVNNPVFTLDNEHGWSKYWDDLPKEVHYFNAATNQETITVYDYYFEEIDSNPEGYKANITYEDDDGLLDAYAVNEPLEQFKVVKNWWNAEDKDMPGIVYELYRQNRDAGGNPQGQPELIGTYMLCQEGGFELNTDTHQISDNKQLSEDPWTITYYVDTNPGQPQYFFMARETGIYAPAAEGANAGTWSSAATINDVIRIQNTANPGKNGDNSPKDGRTGWRDAALDPWREHTETPQLTIKNTMEPYVNQIHLIKRWRDFTAHGGVSDYRNPNYSIKIQLVRRVVDQSNGDVLSEEVYGYPVTLRCENAEYTVDLDPNEPIVGTGAFSHETGLNSWGVWETDGNGEWHYKQHNTDAESLPLNGYYIDSEGVSHIIRYEYTFAETEAHCDFDGDGVYETNWIERVLWDGDSTQSQDSTVYLMDNFKASKIIFRKKWYGTVDADYVMFSLVDQAGNNWAEIIHNYVKVGGRDYSFFGIAEKNLVQYEGEWYIAVYPDNKDADGNWILTLDGIPYLWIDNNADGCHEQEYDIREAYIHDAAGYHPVTAGTDLLYTSWYRGTTKDEPQLSTGYAHVQPGRDDDNADIDKTTTVVTSNITDTELEVNKEWYDINGQKIDTSDGTEPTITVGNDVYTVDRVEYVLKTIVSNHDGSGDSSSSGYQTEGYLTGTYDSAAGQVTANESGTGGLTLSGNAGGALKISLTAGAANEWKQIIKGLPSAHIFDRGSDFSGERYYTETYEYEVEEYKVYGHKSGQGETDITRFFTRNDPTVTEAEEESRRDQWKMSNKAEETGAVRVTKTFSGVDALPEGFTITATWKEGKNNTGSVETKVLTAANADSGNGTTDPYTWIIDNLPLGNTVTFVESGYDLDGYLVEVKVNGTAAQDTPEATAVAGDPEQEAAARAAFENNYTLATSNIKIIKIDEDTRGDAQQTLLPGTSFTLYKNTGTTEVSYTVYPDESSCTKTTSDAEEDYGTVRFDDLPSGQYKIVETATPTGYVKTENNDIYFDIADGVLTRYSGPYTGAARTAAEEIAEQSNVAKVTYVRENVVEAELYATFTVGNVKGAALPKTGGSGTVFITALGSIMALLSAGLLVLKRRRKEIL